jgi:SecD/SecF fusion protein
MIGIVASLFTALYATRTVFGVMIDYMGVEKLGSVPLTFPKWDQMLRPNINWMRLANYFYAFSLAFIVIGLIAFGVKLSQGRMMDIEFASGTSVQFELKQPMKIEEVRQVIEQARDRHPDALPAPAVVSVGTEGTTYEVVTPNKDAVVVRRTILETMGDKLQLEMPSTFVGSEAPYGEAIEKVLFPITSDNQRFAGDFAPDASVLAKHMGGVAVQLVNLDPPLTTKQIHDRFERARMQPQPGRAMQPYREVDVIAPNIDDDATPTKTAVILVSDPAFTHDQDAAAWAQQLAGPVWEIVKEGISGEPSLQKVVNFDAQVAGETKREATIAMVLSVVGIMAYIWLRFGNLKYATATVISLIHDTLFVIAAVGLAHYVADNFLGRALLIEPFRINLTMVAAILTVMGYSMNDTVVVFDRIRENRGKFGAVSNRVINDSINQTLSRTLLTGGTTILTIFVMYVWGGPGIHGFTYALLIGIVVGTYSSIAIAAPILLFGGRTDEPGGGEKTRDEPRQKTEPAGQLQRA